MSGSVAENKNQSGRLRVYQEEAKTRQTTHWDWDYMSQAELDQLADAFRSGRVASAAESAPREHPKMSVGRQRALGVFCLLAAFGIMLLLWRLT